MTTITLTPERLDQLTRLKVAGTTYDDVLDCLLARVDEKRFRQAILNWAADAAKAIRKNARATAASYELHGSLRVLGTLFMSQEAMLVTTVFRKKRNESRARTA